MLLGHLRGYRKSGSARGGLELGSRGLGEPTVKFPGIFWANCWDFCSLRSPMMEYLYNRNRQMLLIFLEKIFCTPLVLEPWNRGGDCNYGCCCFGEMLLLGWRARSLPSGASSFFLVPVFGSIYKHSHLAKDNCGLQNPNPRIPIEEYRRVCLDLRNNSWNTRGPAFWFLGSTVA